MVTAVKNKLGDRMIKQLLNSVIAKYRDFSVSRRSIICLSLPLWQIIDLLATVKSRYFAQPRPIIANYWLEQEVKLVMTCLVPRLSLLMKMCAQRKVGRRQQARRRFACRLYPSHGPLRFIISHSFRARLCHEKNEAPEEEAG